eukprot:scaffold3268_cov19-Tisochrysis_lutea.AAC.1
MTWMARALACLLLYCSFYAIVAEEKGSRIREYDITLPVKREDHLLKDVPIVDPPRRVAGYYKLKRTYAAEMFFFFFEIVVLSQFLHVVVVCTLCSLLLSAPGWVMQPLLANAIEVISYNSLMAQCGSFWSEH